MRARGESGGGQGWVGRGRGGEGELELPSIPLVFGAGPSPPVAGVVGVLRPPRRPAVRSAGGTTPNTDAAPQGGNILLYSYTADL